MHRRDAGPAFARGVQHAIANLPSSPTYFVDRKHREQPVAHELQNLAAVLKDRGDLAIEILIEDFDHRLRRQPVRQRGKAAQIRQPDRGMHGFGVAAANLPAEDPFAGAVADIGVSSIAAVRRRLMISMIRARGGITERRRVQLFVGEAARLLRRPARRMNRAIGELQRKRDIIGDALGAHLLDDRKARCCSGSSDAAPDLLSPAVKTIDSGLV